MRATTSLTRSLGRWPRWVAVEGEAVEGLLPRPVLSAACHVVSLLLLWSVPWLLLRLLLLGASQLLRAEGPSAAVVVCPAAQVGGDAGLMWSCR